MSTKLIIVCKKRDIVADLHIFSRQGQLSQISRNLKICCQLCVLVSIREMKYVEYGNVFCCYNSE